MYRTKTDLEFKEAITSVASHVDKNVTIFISQQSLGARSALWQPTGQNTDKILHGYLISTVINLEPTKRTSQ
jgi:hypothetical protein